MGDFTNKTALITGGGSGIGQALTEALAREGARVAVSDINLANAERVASTIRAAGGEAQAYALDVTDAAQWASVVERAEAALGPIDLLCSNAGASGSGVELVDMPIDFLRWLLDINVVSAVRAIQAVVPRMVARNSGHVLFTASVASLLSNITDGDYSASKHALLGIGDTLRGELAGSNVKVSLLCPGPVMTNLLANTESNAKSSAGIDLAKRNASDPKLAQIVSQSGALLPPEKVAEIALEGVRAGRFFIFTHEQAAGRIRRRSEEIDNDLNGLAAT